MVACHINKIAFVSVLLLLMFPLVNQSAYTLRIATVAMMYIMIALSLNLLTGFCGLMSIGHAAFWGIGAYTAAILAKNLGWGMGTCLIASALVSGFFGMMLGLPVLKLKGYYLTIVTLGFCEIIRMVELNWMSLTRGPLGINNIPYPNLFGIVLKSRVEIYYIMLGLMVLTGLVVHSIVHSRIGKAIVAIREDDLAASAMGINVTLYKIMVFIISATIMGVAGGFYAHYIRYIEPSIFNTGTSMNMLIMAIFGGLGSIPGTIIGATILTVLPETIRFLAEYRNLIYGFLIIVLMLIKPSGVLGDVNMEYIKKRYYASKAGDKG
ncbi:MAG TPA: branched-chain amino acid ABC transporter permease [Clostridiaceae bacterium]|nr:branched-chain amino acid ABC transporter permease [Clostridiaceae bacterium]